MLRKHLKIGFTEMNYVKLNKNISFKWNSMVSFLKINLS
jgi:hypothetical protein